MSDPNRKGVLWERNRTGAAGHDHLRQAALRVIIIIIIIIVIVMIIVIIIMIIMIII